MNRNQRQRGISLLEMMLVIVIGASIIYLSIQQYRAFRMDADAQQVKANVDLIFEAMGSYYKANCAGESPSWGTLSPYDIATDPLGNSPVPVSVKNDLIANGYLTLTFPPNSLVNTNTSNGTNGYIIQFNLQPLSPYYAQGTGVQIGTVVSWKAQVAVDLIDPAYAKEYMGYLGADCTSAQAASNVLGPRVQPCSAGQPGSFLVWERNPSLGSMNHNSVYWSTNPTVTQFTQAYRTYPIEYLMGAQQGTYSKSSSMIPGGGGTPSPLGVQYFVCGD